VPKGGFHLKIQVMIDITIPGLNTNVTFPIVLAFTALKLKGKVRSKIFVFLVPNPIILQTNLNFCLQ
jgi:hypothetical protein